jgi:hypothetical protein
VDPLLTCPPLPDEQKAQSEFGLRYDDLDMHGRLQCLSAAHSLGPAVWRTLLAKHPVAPWCQANVVLPILSRLSVLRGDGPLSVRNALTCHGALDLAHVPDAAGAVDRIMLLMWVELGGIVASTNPPQPPNHRQPIFAARVFAEHVLTAALAPAGQRKVRQLGGVGVPPVPPRVYSAPPISAIAEPPADAHLLGDLVEEPPFLFGLMHTDANLHVNSLVYPRLFEQSALRLLAGQGDKDLRLARSLELGYRKPFFAGERTVLRLRAFRCGDQLGACGAFFPVGSGGVGDKASAYARLLF